MLGSYTPFNSVFFPWKVVFLFYFSSQFCNCLKRVEKKRVFNGGYVLVWVRPKFVSIAGDGILPIDSYYRWNSSFSAAMALEHTVTRCHRKAVSQGPWFLELPRVSWVGELHCCNGKRGNVLLVGPCPSHSREEITLGALLGKRLAIETSEMFAPSSVRWRDKDTPTGESMSA